MMIPLAAGRPAGITRRLTPALLVLVLVLVLLLLVPQLALAQGFPKGSVQMLIPFGPGGTTDLMARALQPELDRALGGSVVIVNKAGAGGAIALAELARAKPDGQTIAMTTIGPQVLQPALRKLSYAAGDFDFICGTYDVPLMLMVKADSPFKTLADVVAFARQKPGELSYGSSGQGTSLHIAMAALLSRAGVTGLHIPYKSSGEMVAGLAGNHIMMFMETPAVATQYQLRPLAVLAPKRLDAFPAVPTAAELGNDVRGSVWGGLTAPKGLPVEVRQRLEDACLTATGTEAYRSAAARLNNPLVYRNARDFQAFAEAEAKAYAAVVREFGLEEK